MNSAGMVQLFCYACSVAFLCAGLARRSALRLGPEQDFLALLLVFTVTLLLVCLGTLSRIAVELTRRRKEATPPETSSTAN